MSYITRILSVQVAAGSNSSLTGEAPALTVEEMQSGRPSYTGSYQPVGTGAYQVRNNGLDSRQQTCCNAPAKCCGTANALL